jgi:hypothetical protein
MINPVRKISEVRLVKLSKVKSKGLDSSFSFLVVNSVLLDETILLLEDLINWKRAKNIALVPNKRHIIMVVTGRVVSLNDIMDLFKGNDKLSQYENELVRIWESNFIKNSK